MLLPGLVFGYLVMGLVWPWSIMEPGNPLHALTYFSHFFEKPWKEMFDGALVSVPDMPWSYLPTLFALQLPEVLLALLAVGVAGAFMSLSRKDVPAAARDPADADAGGDAAAGDGNGETPGALQRHPSFHLRHSADGGARRRRLCLRHGLARRETAQPGSPRRSPC